MGCDLPRPSRSPVTPHLLIAASCTSIRLSTSGSPTSGPTLRLFKRSAQHCLGPRGMQLLVAFDQAQVTVQPFQLHIGRRQPDEAYAAVQSAQYRVHALIAKHAAEVRLEVGH